jgi:ABC-2 type transport system permease protein
MSAVRAMQPPGLPAMAALTRRELVRFFRQPSRVFAAIGTPLVIWVFFAGGFAHSFSGSASGGAASSYGVYLIPGMASLTVVFSSIFAAISLIEDRHEGFLQSVLVSPAPRWAGVGAKIAGSTIVAAAQGIILLLLAPVLGVHTGVAALVLAALGLVVISVGISGLGLAAAWWIDSTQGFHGVMNLVLMPMWLLSGSLFPIAGASPWLRAVMMINPLYWPTAAVRESLSGGGANEPFALGLIWAVSLLCGAAGFVLAWVVVGRVARPRKEATA